jgi:hypothetical protein
MGPGLALPPGAIAVAEAGPAIPPPPKARVRRSRGKWVVAFLVVLFGGGAGLYFFGDRVGLNLAGAIKAQIGKIK